MIRIFLLFLISFQCFADSVWYPESLVCTAGAKRGYLVGGKARCEQETGEECFDISGHDCNVSSVQSLRTGPYGPAIDVVECSRIVPIGESQEVYICPVDLAAKVCPDATYEKFSGDLDGNGTQETWCTRRTLVKQVAFDQAKSDAYDATLAAEAQKEANKRAAKARSCAALNNPNVPDETKDLILAIGFCP